MHSDPQLSERLRAAVVGRDFEERFFFGGVAFFLNGHFAIGVYHDKLVLRVGEDAANAAIEQGDAEPMDITGRPMRGWVYIQPDGFKRKADLTDWIDQVHDFVSTLKKKPKKKAAKKTVKKKTKKKS
ncbi:TfoX/Sxy family protein [Phycisphaeraceae bacterium D3-23]